MRPMTKTLTLLLFSGLLAACSTPPAPKYAFGGRAPIEVEEARARTLAEQEAAMKREGYDSGPQAISSPPPRLSQSEINAAASGNVVVRYTVGADGNVSDVVLLDVCSPELGEIVRAKVLEWRFKPAMKGGKPVAARVVQVFEFRFD